MGKKAVFASVTTAFVAYVAWIVMLSPLPHHIEQVLRASALEQLEGDGFTDVIPVLDGRDVELYGTVPSAEHLAAAEGAVRTVPGVRKVESRLRVAVAAVRADRRKGAR
jgi:hypothetical protein